MNLPAIQAALVADDDDFFRLALAAIVRERHGIPDVREAASFDGMMELLACAPVATIAFFDLRMPGMSSLARLREVRLAHPAARVVVVSGSSERALVLEALAAGVHGYIPKTAGPAEVSRAVGLVLAGDIYVPASLADLGADHVAPDPEPAAPSLTARQRQVLELITDGASNREVAAALGLGEGTVKVHVASLLRLLKVSGRAGAAAIGRRMRMPVSP